MNLELKNSTILLLLLFYQISIQAQKYDNVWCMGYESNGDSSTMFGGQNIDFSTDLPLIYYRNRPLLDFNQSSASICDKDGKLLLYTNGCKIYDGEDRLIEGGDSLTSMDNYWTQEFWCPYGFTTTQGVMFIPIKDEEGEMDYYLFHQDVNVTPLLEPLFNEFYYTKIEKVKGKFKVTEKRKIIYDELTTAGGFSAVKHANGKDWWIIIAPLYKQGFIIYPLTMSGLENHKEQQIGQTIDIEPLSLPSRFSPNGKIYGRFQLQFGLEIFDFDRSKGEFSNARHIPFWDSLGFKLGEGLEFSPDSKKLYVNYNTALFQFDLEAENIFASRELIDTFRIDTSDTFSANFYISQLAPNGKIYMSCLNGEKVLHVIHKPNEKGKACEFEQRGFKLKTYNFFTMPYFPNYRLGADTTVAVKEIQDNFTISPNPFIDKLNINSDKDCKLQIINIGSNKILNRNIGIGYNSIDLTNYEKGLYFLKFIANDGAVQSKKIIKI